MPDGCSDGTSTVRGCFAGLPELNDDAIASLEHSPDFVRDQRREDTA